MLRANETNAARRREFARVCEQFYRFIGDEGKKRFELTAVEVIDNPTVERRFSEHCAAMRERLLRSGGAVRTDRIAEEAAAVARLALCDEQTQILREELRQHVRSLPWEERCTLLMQDGGAEFNDIVVLHPRSQGRQVRDQLRFVLLEERHRWREWILEKFER